MDVEQFILHEANNMLDTLNRLRVSVAVMRELGVVEWDGIRLGEPPTVIEVEAPPREAPPREPPVIHEDGLTEEQQRQLYGHLT